MPRRTGIPLPLFRGDKVTFVNDYGVRFPGHVVVRIMQRDEDEWLYCAGRRYFIDSDSPWFPVCEKNFCRNKERRDVRSHKNLQGVLD